MEVYIEFTRPQKCAPLSWIIRKVQKSPYSHARLRWTTRSGVNVVYEASGTNVKFLGPAAAAQNPVIIQDTIILTLNEEQYKRMVNLCMIYAGLDYGTVQLIGIGIARLFRMSNNPLSTGSSQQVCSELVGRIMSEILMLDPPDDWDMAGPKEINEWIRSELSEHQKRKNK